MPSSHSPAPTSSSSSKLPINRIKPHRSSTLNFTDAPHILSKESKLALRNLHSYRLPASSPFYGGKDVLPFLRSKCAAVLVALFVGRKGDLYVLLSKRAIQLRSYAGDTSLPGGKVDFQDETFEDTARREAFEEIGLPIDQERIPLLCLLEPFLAGNGTIVTPVVVLILDNAIQPILQPTEVHTLFSHPLKSFLSETPPYPYESELDQVPYHSWDDIFWDGPRVRVRVRPGDRSQKNRPMNQEDSKIEKRVVRLHRFLTGREAGGIKPVFGVTAGILIETAMIAYPRIAKSMPFEIYPPTSPTWNERIAWVMWKNRKDWVQGCEKEGITLDWDFVGKIAGVSKDERKQVVRDIMVNHVSGGLVKSRL